MIEGKINHRFGHLPAVHGEVIQGNGRLKGSVVRVIVSESHNLEIISNRSSQSMAYLQAGISRPTAGKSSS